MYCTINLINYGNVVTSLIDISVAPSRVNVRRFAQSTYAEPTFGIVTRELDCFANESEV